MSDRTAIEWADATWNPIKVSTHRWYCEKISPGCDNCYASTFNRRMGGEQYPTVKESATGTKPPIIPSLDDRTLGQVATWKKPRRVFVCSMTDLFGEWVPFSAINRIFEAMLATPQHQYLVLTKRPENIMRMVPESWQGGFPPNVWMGTSTEHQAAADERIPHLLAVPAAVRFLSAEPLLGPIDLTKFQPFCRSLDGFRAARGILGGTVDWVIAGGESGPKARPMHSDWARSLRDQCVSAGVAFHFKQWGEWLPTGHVNASGEAEFTRVGKRLAGRELDGRTWDEFPGGRLP